MKRRTQVPGPLTALEALEHIRQEAATVHGGAGGPDLVGVLAGIEVVAVAALAAPAPTALERRLLVALKATTLALETHLQDDAKRLGVSVEVRCPCWTHEVAEARAAIAAAEATP